MILLNFSLRNLLTFSSRLGGLSVLVLSLNGCVPAVVVGGAAAGTAIAEERGLGGAISDTEIKTRIHSIWFNHNTTMFEALSVKVHEGRALITGTVQTQHAHLEAIRLAWQAHGVTEVIDEIKIAQNTNNLGDYMGDAWMTTQIKNALLFDGNIAGRNYSVKTVDGIVYLMGVAQNQRELDHAIEHARNISGVRRVISYVRLKHQPQF